MDDPARLLRRLFDRAVEVADPMQSLAAHLPPRPPGRVLVIGAGKAVPRRCWSHLRVRSRWTRNAR